MWRYLQPSEIIFGPGVRGQLPQLVARFGEKAILATDSGLAALPMVDELRKLLGEDAPVFSDIEPNPTVNSVDALAEMIVDCGADVVVAVGGGSSMDCAKAACATAVQGGPMRRYHSGGEALDLRRVPLIAMPTTAGTGSEVTPIAVLNDPEKGFKAPLNHDSFFPAISLIDPELTFSLPRLLTAATGFDALAHAVEGYWSKNHQPIADALALRAAGLVMEHIGTAMAEPGNATAREGMSLAALLAGMAFQGPKNAAVHACSYPLSSIHHLPHGTACAFTLDHFIRYNAPAMGERGQALARAAGCETMEEMADRLGDLKASSGLPTRFGDFGVDGEGLGEIVAGSFHPLMDNNPREVTPESLREMYEQIL